MTHWKEMEKNELERQYSPSRWSHRMTPDDVLNAHVTAVKEGTERACSLAKTLLNVSYGDGESEKMDIYMPSTGPTQAKRSLDSVPYLWYKKGVAVVAVGYDIAPKGNMDLMVSQVRRSIVCVVQQFSHSSGVYLCGHSAGAHLAAMALCTDWSQYSITPQIKGAFLVSGIYDLLPILSTYVNEPLKMTEEVVRKNSPIQLVPDLKRSSSACRIVVVVGQHDSPEFRRQSEDFFKALISSGLKVTFEDVLNTDHFDIIEQLVDGDYHLTQLLLKMVKEC